MHYVYDPQTHDVHFIHDEFMPLSGKARRQRVKLRKANKGERQKLRQAGRKTNLLKRIAKRGRKQDSKFQPDDNTAIDTPDSGSQTQPQNFAPSSGGGGGGGNPITPGGEDYSQPVDNSQPDTIELQPDDQGGGEEADPNTYEQMPDDDYGSDDSSDPYNGAMNDYYDYTGLSAGGIWGAAFNAAKKGVTKVVNQEKNNVAANPALNPAAATMQSQIDDLQKKLDAANSSNMTKQLITGAISAGIGAAAGYFIAKNK